jgi:hypothetical protein
MMRVRIFQILLLALLPSAAVCAAGAADQRSGAVQVTVSGVYSLTFNVQVRSAAVTGGTIYCKAKIAPNLPGFENRSPRVVPVESARGVAAIVGSSGNCSVEIPFSWMVADTQNGVALSYEIDAVNGSGVAAGRTQQGIDVAYPEMGKAANMRLRVAF